MTKTSSPLVAAAHTHSAKAPSYERAKENRRGPTSFMIVRRPPTTPIQGGKTQLGASSRRNTVPTSGANLDLLSPLRLGGSTRSQRTKVPKVRTPLATIDETTALESSSPCPISTTTTSKVFGGPSRGGIELASAKNERVKALTTQLDKHVRLLELLAAGFKEKVEEVSKEFQELQEELSQYAEEFEALETDHFSTLAALEEEKETVDAYVGKLRNAEVEICLLYQSLPEGSGEALLGYSQAKSSKPIYERHQKLLCPQTTQRLNQLREQVAELEIAKKRIRTGSVDHSTGSTLSAGASTSEGNGIWQTSPDQPAEPAIPMASMSIQQPDGSTPNGFQTGYSHFANPPVTNPSNSMDPSNSSMVGTNSTTESRRLFPGLEVPSSTAPFTTPANSFGLKKRYHGNNPPDHDPDAAITSLDIYDSKNHNQDSGENESESLDDVKLLAPFPNLSSFELGEWFYGQGTHKSLQDFKSLVKILTNPSFSLDDIRGTKWTTVFQDLGKNKEDIGPQKSQWVEDSGWKTTEVKIEVPVHNRMEQGLGVESHVVGTLHHRSIVSILEEKIRNAPESQFLHLDGHELLWQPGEVEGSPEFRVVSELYNSDAFLEAQREVRDNPPPQIAGCTLPRVVVGVQLWSDATHLSTFSSSKLWPVYMVIGNESKHRRGKGSGDSCYHIAYLDSISDSFKDYLTTRTGGKIPPNLMAHLNRECFHEQWVIILDDELLKAVVEGVVIECSDGIKRRFFIRILTYSSDYPERVLIATIKTRGDCPCVRCLTQKKDLGKMGTAEDMNFRRSHPRMDSASRQQSVLQAREAIASGRAVGGKPIQRLLPHSNAPTINAFSKRLSATGFNLYSTLVVDLLHEYEIGVFKALFKHLIRVLEASAPGSTLVHLLDKRYRGVPTFNQTIRKFSSNVSELRRRAARDYEDVLQCAIPVFYGLLPEPLGSLVSKLLYTNARWHSLAKLSMQTDATILLLESATSQLGDQFREFISATDSIETVELPREAEKRTRSKKAKQTKVSQAKAKRTKVKQTKAKPTKTAVPADPSPGQDRAQTYRIVHPLVEESPVLVVPEVDLRNAPQSPPPVLFLTDPQARGPSSSGDHPPPPGPPESLPGAGCPAPEHPIPHSTASQATARSGTTRRDKSTTRRPKKMNLETVKFHSLGHYPSTVRFIGPTGIYSTERGESFHRSPKAWFKSTSKRFIRKELSMHERKRMRLKRTKYRLLTEGKSAKSQELREQQLASRNPDIHHYIGTSKSSPVYLSQFSQAGNLSTDVSCMSFVRNLKKHLLPRFLQAVDPNIDANTTNEAVDCLDWSRIIFKDDRIYTHRIMRIKYTTYDTRRDEDIIHLDTDRCNVMLPNPEYAYGSSSHPFKYGKVIGILHAEVGYAGDIGRHGVEYPCYPMEFVWVRWYAVHPSPGGPKLDQAELLPIDAPGAHGIVNPVQILRACHIVPNFTEGPRFEDRKGKSPAANDGGDWRGYFINRFVDRDMFMRYEWGLGVGHTDAHKDATAANLAILRAHGLPQGSPVIGQVEPAVTLGDAPSPSDRRVGGMDSGGDGAGENPTNMAKESGSREGGGFDGDSRAHLEEDRGVGEDGDDDGEEEEEEESGESTDEDDDEDAFGDDSEAEKEYMLFGTCGY